MSNQTSSNSDDMMKPLRLIYLKDLLERRSWLESYITKLTRCGLEDGDTEELTGLVHKLAGTGATYGFPEISNVARELESILRLEEVVPIDLLAFDIDRLIEACDEAQELEPEQFANQSQMDTSIDEVEPALKSKPKLPLVLIVDDDANVRAILRNVVEKFARVQHGTNSSEALDLINTETPNLILLDDNMPGISGMRLLEDLQNSQKFSDIPIIMITASDQPESVIRGLAAGAADYIIKPFDPKTVSEQIKARIDRMGTTIFIVDDDKSICDLLDRKFSAAGFHTQLAENGQNALSMMKFDKPNLVLLDRMLPGLDGMTVLQMMKDDPKLNDIPVIFLTAKRQEDDILDGFDVGAADYIVKPFNPDEVVARCSRLVGVKRRLAA